MPEVVQITLYRFEELSGAAKERARTWYREHAHHDDWYEWIYNDFVRICEMLGLSLQTRNRHLLGGRTHQEPCIYFSGFSNQGDGACFEGVYAYQRRAPAQIRTYAPTDTELHRIAEALQAVQHTNFYQLRAHISHQGRYCHEYSMEIIVERDSPTGQAVTLNDQETVIEALRDLARWLYRQLRCEYDHLTSDEVVDEAIINNEYTFTQTGCNSDNLL